MMDAVWKSSLSMSLRQDVQQLSILMREMGVFVKRHQDVNSWLFPNKTYTDVADWNLDVNTGSYTKCLESVLDGVYLVMNMLIAYINEATQPASTGRMPQRLTLGQSFEVMWMRVRELVPMGSRHKNPPPRIVPAGDWKTKGGGSERRNSVQTASQTDEKTTVSCDSCFVNLYCIKQVITSLDTYLDSKTKEVRKKIRNNIYDVTLLGSTMQMAASIEQDVTALISDNRTLGDELKALSGKYDTLKSDYKELKKSKIDRTKYDKLEIDYIKECNKSCNFEKELFKIRYEHEKLSIRVLNHDRSHEKVIGTLKSFKLNMDKVQDTIMVKLDAKLATVLRILTVLEAKDGVLGKLATQLEAANELNDSLNEQLYALKMPYLQIEQITTALKECALHIEDFQLVTTEKLLIKSATLRRIEDAVRLLGQQDFKSKCEKLHANLNKEREKRCKLEIKYYKVTEENRRLCGMKSRRAEMMAIKEMVDEFEGKVNAVQCAILQNVEIKFEAVLRIENSVRKYSTERRVGDGVPAAAIKGNPIEDMMRQIEVNEARMASLKAENSGLLGTVNKLQQMNLPGVKRTERKRDPPL